ncbi:DNA (cytosine-5-)-methyltransferase [Leptospira kanakyensis]|uniref:DNA (cytosine-5-)-methyltransferase n=1 Tax=Leptospira kanakyensis TaxID=2484968 RepID=UPI001ABF23F7|nr:DNA (cytosine-5-)-methyltransferase [Leptospira kanakyensis]
MEIKTNTFTVEEFASFISVSPQYVRTLIRKKKLPAEMVGTSWLIPKEITSDKRIMMNIETDVPDRISRKKPNKSPVALSFFSGAMGLDIGLKKAGIDVLLASEIDPDTRKTITLNHPDLGLIGDINGYSVKDIRKFANLDANSEIDLVIGGPPCQAFSTAGKRKGFEDERGNVFLEFIEKAILLNPKFIVIENVRGLLSAPLNHRPHQYRGPQFPALSQNELPGGALNFIIFLLEKAKYKVSFNLYNAANFGSPQKRERIVIICSRDNIEIPYLTPTHSESGEFNLPTWRTFRDVTSDLKESDQTYIQFPEKRLKYYRMLKEDQYWKHLPIEIQKEAMGKSFYSGGGRTGFLRRLAWNKPAPTLVTNPAMPATDLAHPKWNRPLSIQEYKRIQEFPDDYEFFGTIVSQYRQIGNAVPISLGYHIGKMILNLLNRKQISKKYDDFKFSRYMKTDHTSFKQEFVKKTQKRELSKTK